MAENVVPLQKAKEEKPLMPLTDISRQGWKEITRKQSPYQSIQVMEDDGGSVCLLLDGKAQFHSKDSFHYDEALGVIPYLFTRGAKNVLILGGGDGLLAREILRFPVEQITIIELDKEVIEVSRKYFAGLNGGSLDDERVEIVSQDAWEFVKSCDDAYNLILCDYTDPVFLPAARLYTAEHLSDIKRLMTPHAVFATQLASPSYKKEAFWCMVDTIGSVFERRKYSVIPYNIFLPYRRGANGFCLATPNPLQQPPPQDARFIGPYNLLGLFDFPPEEMLEPLGILSTEDNLLYAKLFSKDETKKLLREKEITIYENNGIRITEVNALGYKKYQNEIEAMLPDYCKAANCPKEEVSRDINAALKNPLGKVWLMWKEGHLSGFGTIFISHLRQNLELADWYWLPAFRNFDCLVGHLRETEKVLLDYCKANGLKTISFMSHKNFKNEKIAEKYARLISPNCKPYMQIFLREVKAERKKCN